MKKKLALLMAAIMTVAMVPMTAFASTKLTAVDEVSAGIGEDHAFESRVELSKDDDSVDVEVKLNEATSGLEGFEIYATLTNGEFTEDMFNRTTNTANKASDGILNVEKVSDTQAKITLRTAYFNTHFSNGNDVGPCVLTIYAYALEAGDVKVTFSSNVANFTTKSAVIATAYSGAVSIESAGVKTFVEDGEGTLEIKNITITELREDVIKDGTISLKLKGNWKFVSTNVGTAKFLNSSATGVIAYSSDDELIITVSGVGTSTVKLEDMTISGVYLKATKSCEAGDVATITVKSNNGNFSSVKLEVAKMVEEAVTYTVDDDDLPVLYAGQLPQNNEDNEGESLTIYIEENTGDILNTSRKATFTFPEGIEVVDIASIDGVVLDHTTNYPASDYEFSYEIDENVVTIRYYGEKSESDETDLEISFILSAAPWFEGDVTCTLGGEFDDVEFTVATVVAPYTVEAKTSEVLIDYRYVPVNEIVITEAVEGILKDGDTIYLEVEKMDFEDAGTYEVTEGDIEVDVTIEDGNSSTAQLIIEVTDDSTEASTITISGLELYLDRTLPVGGYALKNVQADNILWENSHSDDADRSKSGEQDDYYATNALGYEFEVVDNSGSSPVYTAVDSMVTMTSTGLVENTNFGYDYNGIFKYKAITVNDSYVEVVTAARDQDDSTTSRKIVITIGATTMTVGTETITLDAPAYINSEDYTMLPVRAISEAFGATVTWDDASKTVTVLSGQRIISMTIGSKTMYINGTPVAMNTAAEITSDRTFIPVRDLANALGISAIDWNEASATVTLN